MALMKFDYHPGDNLDMWIVRDLPPAARGRLAHVEDDHGNAWDIWEGPGGKFYFPLSYFKIPDHLPGFTTAPGVQYGHMVLSNAIVEVGTLFPAVYRFGNFRDVLQQYIDGDQVTYLCQDHHVLGLPSSTIYEAGGRTKGLALDDTGPIPVPPISIYPGDCDICNNTREVEGALGVGIKWPCECVALKMPEPMDPGVDCASRKYSLRRVLAERGHQQVETILRGPGSIVPDP